MGWYINSPTQDAESWLKGNAKQCASIIDAKARCAGNDFIVVLINNGAFKAAGVCVNQREIEAFTELGDFRPKTYWVAKKNDLLEVTLPSIKEFLCQTTEHKDR